MDWIEPDWSAPPRIRALTTTRHGGVSIGPFAGLNLADHVGDDPWRVARNRTMLCERLDLPAEPGWLQQVHGCGVAVLGADSCSRSGIGTNGPADAAIAVQAGKVCVVLTADCMPLLLCNRAGTRVAAIHAGWRGLADGIVESAVGRLGVSPGELLCWLGPAIGPRVFEVGGEVRARFLESGDAATHAAFRPTLKGKWLADLYALAKVRLAGCGVQQVWGGGLCTYADPDRFFSYRRDGVTGRMASMIWIQPEP